LTGCASAEVKERETPATRKKGRKEVLLLMKRK
jgi:hypothetical protein